MSSVRMDAWSCPVSYRVFAAAMCGMLMPGLGPGSAQAAPAQASADEPDCSAQDTPIGLIQGSGETAALSGVLTIQGVVVADYEYPGSGTSADYLRGFYVQNPAGLDDGDPLTSDGIFVYNANKDSVSVGQVVQVTGNVSEYAFSSTGGTQTQLSASRIVVCSGAATATIAPTDIRFPLASVSELERWEGMLVRVAQPLTVSEHYQLGRFGQVLLSSGGRLRQPTSVAAKGAAAAQVQADNALRSIVVDDDRQDQNPDPIRFGREQHELSAANTLRAGDTVTGLTGVLTQTDATSAYNASSTTDPVRYRIRPFGVWGEQAPDFVAANPRPALPVSVAGSVKVASVNLLNYFNTFGDGCQYGVDGASADCRGAADAAEFARQWPKTVQSILGTGADIIALNELENDGYGADSALQDLVDKLNAATRPQTFGFIDVDSDTGVPNALGSDAIRVAMIYRRDSAHPIGKAAVANTGAFGLFTTRTGTIGRNRPALAQAFDAGRGGRLVVVANHLKSKGSACDDNLSPVGPDPDLDDGQGNCNLTRTAAARQLLEWLGTDPTHAQTDNVLILGDFNAYAQEDPILSMLAGGYSNLVDELIGADAYSYAFDGQWGYLDYAFASPSLAPQVVDVVELHNNADEPAVLDYNTDYKSARQLTWLYADDAFRASDHDPVIVGLELSPASPDKPSASCSASAQK